MNNIWTPSDELLLDDPIAKALINNPVQSLQGQILEAEVTDDVADERAAIVLAEEDADELVDTNLDSGAANDDNEIDDPDDNEAVPEDI